MSNNLHIDRSPQGYLTQNLMLFGRTCKRFGLDVTPDTFLDAARALTLIGLQDREDVYFALRSLYVKRERDRALFDRIFAAFWHNFSLETEALPASPSNGQTKLNLESPASNSGDAPLTDESPPFGIVPTFSQREILRHKDFAAMSADELAAAYALIAQMDWSPGMRRTRRFLPGKGRRTDLRRAFRHNLRYGGELLVLPTRAPKKKPRSLLLLCDISGSMERYTRILLHFMYTLTRDAYPVEVFLFSTRLTRVTRLIRNKRIDAALDQVSNSVQDWAGGTRIGEVLHTFNQRWRWRTAGTDTVVLLITDGWDRGDPDLLRRETALLQRSCYRLIWLNPLLGIPDYEPLTRGAQAMIDYVDDFLPVHNLGSLESLIRELGRIDWARPRRIRRMSQAGAVRKGAVV